MIIEERFPDLGRRAPVANQVFAHAGLADLDTELEQFSEQRLA